MPVTSYPYWDLKQAGKKTRHLKLAAESLSLLPVVGWVTLQHLRLPPIALPPTTHTRIKGEKPHWEGIHKEGCIKPYFKEMKSILIDSVGS